MARFLENKNNIKKPAQKKKKKKQENPSAQERINQKSYGTTKPNVKVNTTRTANTVGNTNGKYQAGSTNNNTQQRYNNRPQGTATRTRNTPATAGGSQYGRAGTNARRSASEGFQRDMQARQAESRQRNQKLKEDQERRRQESEARRNKAIASRNPRMQDTARSTRLQTEEERRQKQDRLREAQRQKMGDNSMASESAQRAANRAVRNTPTVVKESLKQTAIGHGKTAADLTELNKSAAIGSKIDIKSKEFQEDIEKRRKQSTRVAGTAFNELSKMQEKSEDRMQKVTGNAKGLEKAYYGALESGTGMALDRALGPAWAVSMLSRTYGNTRGQAKKEGATEAEDRAYSLLQGAKEVATEYLFQGVGLARGLSGRASLAPSEKLAKYVTRNMSGRAADLTHAGIRLLGGTLEENAEEGIGWGVDPIIKEFTYKKNVRSRQAQQMMREQSDSLRSNITSPQEAQAMAAYLGSDDFLEQQTRTYMDSGIGEAEARDLAEQMRDYLDASLSGDTGRMADIEESLSNKLAGKGTKQSLKEEYSLSELMDTVASTTLLTATTGLPGAFTTASRGAAVRDQLGDDGIRALAKTAEDFEDKEMQLKAKAMSDRLASGKDITSTQAYDLAVGVQEQYNKDSDRQQAAYQTANKTIKSERLVTPYTVSRNGDIDMDEVTDKTYQTTAKSAKDIIRGYAESDESTQSLTDTEIDRGSRAIAGFQTGVFTVDDANELNFHNTAVRSAFQAETGVDLNQYVVKQKNGEIDIPATNAATKDALFAMAADNLVKSAQAETANWMDNAKGEVVTQISRRMGAKGTEALQVALDDVDERDRTSYMMTANATDMLYQAARNMGTDWDSAKKYAQRMFPSISEEKLKAMYDAGLEDRIAATDNAVGLQIEIGKKAEIKAGAEKAPMGQLLIETDVPVKGTVARTFTELAKNLGVDIHLVDHFTDENGNVLKNVNGEYIDGNIYINVNSDFEKNMGFIFMHEVTHHLKKFAPEQYQELENLVRDKWFNYDAAQMQSAIAKKIEAYAKHGQKLTEEQALEEIIADASHEFLTDPKFAREVADADASLAQAVLTSIRNALRALRRIMSSGNVSDDTHMNTLFSQLDILDEAERIWLSAYTQAVKNNAAVEVDRLQNQIYEEGRQSLSETSDSDYMDAVNRGDMETARRMVEQKAAESGFANAVPEQTLSYKTRVGKPPQKTKKVYKVFTVDEQGRPSALFVSGVDPLPQNVWLDAQDTWHFKNTRNGKFYVPSTKNPNTEGGKTGGLVNRAEISDEDWNELVERGFVKEGSKSVTALAYRPGWHAGDIPFFPQGGTKVEGSNYENIHRFNQVVFECEMAFDVDYTKTHLNKQGQVAFEDMQEMPENGGYEFATNPMAHAEDIGKWFISSSLKIGRALTEEECNDILESHGRLPQEWQASEYKEKGKGKNKSTKLVGIEKTIGPLNLEALGYTGEQFDAARKTLAPVTYDDNGDVIPLSERFNQENQDIRFSLTEPVERVKDLIAVHNLKADDIRNTFELGGFPMPSIAVTKDSMGHDMYGDITLMFHSDTIDPQKRRDNEVFGGDAYTPVFPRIHYKASSKVEKRLSDLYYEWSQKYGYDTVRPFYEYGQTLQDALDRAGGEAALIDQLKSDSNLMRMYLRINDNDVEDVMKITEITMPEGEVDLSKRLIDALGEEDIRNISPEGVTGREALQHRREWVEAHKEQLEKIYRDYFTSSGVLSEEDIEAVIPEIKPGEYAVAVKKALDYLRHGATTTKEEKDYEATTNAIKQAAEETGYDEWIDDLFKGVEEKRGLRNDRDMFTANGNRRKWESLYEPVTLDSVVRVMSQELSAGANGLLGANPKGASQKSYRSLDEIRADEDRLQQLPEEEFKALEEAAVQKLSDVCGDIVDSNSDAFQNRFGAVLDVGEHIAEILNVTKNRATIQRKLQSDYNLKVSDTQMDALMEAIDEIANLPTGYFEAKPRRAVGFDEVKAAIIPASTDEDIKQGFSERGIQMYEYDPDVEGDRTEKVNEAASAQDLRFSISEDLDEPYMAAVNAGNMEEAQKYVDEAAKRAGYNKRVWHRAPVWTESQRFTVFDPSNSSMDIQTPGWNWFSTDEKYIDNFGRSSAKYGTYSGYIKADNPFDIGNIEVPAAIHEYNETSDTIDYVGVTYSAEFKRLAESLGMEADDLYQLANEDYDGDSSYDALEELYNYFYEGEAGESIVPLFAITRTGAFRELVESKGYDSVTAMEGPDLREGTGEGTRTYGVPQSAQFKSADTVTYAEDGSVIPLSQRFDPTNNDIRYSMSTEDADGNVLTTNQMEYFKNSQARDEQGRLVPVYHATSMGGFTIFDPSYSDDRRSLFFSNKRDVAQTYVEKYLYADEDRLGDAENRQLYAWDDLLDYVHDQYLSVGLEWEEDFEAGNLDWMAVHKDNGKIADLNYEDWIRLTAEGDPSLDDYEILISIPYTNGEEISYKRITGDNMVDLLNNVSNADIPQTGYYQVYLNLENPMIIDGKGAYWNSISLDSRIPSSTRLELITGEYLDALAESIEQQFMDEKNQREKHGYKYKDESLYTWPQYQKSKQYRKDAKKANQEGIAYLKTETGERLRAEYSLEGLAKAINKYYGFEENDSEGMLIANGMLKEIGSGMDAHSYKDAAQLRELTGETHDTREWAEIAQADGYDGVIFRNIVDVDSKTEIDEDEALSDIYIAFSSNQVKDTRNENPTENPDIRYSFTDEEESKSKKDYEHATDMSYEELLMYEDMIANASESTDIEAAFGKAFSGEKVSNFYSALTEEVGMVFDDDYLEDGRMRIAKSKADFWDTLNTKWNERWVTRGEVLDTKSVKTNVRNLIRGVMNNSDTDRQYKTELLNKTLMDMRVAYQLMKQDRTDVASALLYHSALRMISDVDFIQDDTAYQEYKGIRDYLRSEPIIVSEDYWQGKAFQQFRKEHFGMLKLRKGTASNIDKVYGQLEELYPHIFGENERSKHGFEDSEEDLLQYIGFVTEQNMQPFMEAYSSEYCADWAFEIADDLYEIMENGEGVTSLADRYKAKYDAKAKAMKTRHAEAILRVRKQKEAAIDALKEQYNERLDKQKEHYSEKLDQQKEQYSERLDRQKELAKDAIRKERERFRAQKQAEKEKTKERTLHKKYFDSIAKSHKTLSDRLLTNTKDKHIPEQYKHDLAELLAAFDLQTVASKKLEIRNGLYYRQNYTSKKTIKMRALQETLANIQADTQKLFYVNDSITEIIDRLLGKNAEGKTDPMKSVEGRAIDELTASELKDIDKLLKALIHEFNYYESVRVGAKRQQAADIGTAQIDSCLEHAGRFGEGLDYQNFLGALDNIIGLDEMTPAYMFRQIDPQNNGIGLMFKELRRSFGKYVRNQNQLNEWMEEIIGEYHNKGKLWNKYGAETLEDWRISTHAKEFALTNGTVKMTPAQMMSIYCLSKRQQAYDHMTGAGIVVQPVSFQARVASDLRKKANYALPVILTDSDIKLITSQLTPDQIKVAEKLQELMATKMAEWGNEASMSVLGIRLFEDPDYFPIKSDRAALEKDFSAEQFMECIRNFGFTKAVQPGARNAIAIGDIFDVVAEHCNNMNLYNAYSESMSDFMKVYNYHALREDGSDYSVEQAIAHAYSKKATTFIGTFMKDLNGNVSKERTTGIEQMINDSLGKAKKASVFANGRVALQQPTALMRAFAVISPKYLKGVKAGNATMQEMFEHSPIALWKSWGYYDINMGKSIEDLMMNNGSWAEDKMSDIYGELDNRTWAIIWTMCKNEIEDKHKGVEKGSDEYWELVSERFDEVVDLTQVVDSPFHRSHAMRSKSTLVKMATAFMAEPTLTFNMMRDGLRRAKEEYRLGNKKSAAKIVGRTATVFVLSAWATAAAAAIWDAVRGKSAGDDDDEQGFFDMWYTNMIENLKDNLNLLNNIYWVKDLVSLFQGWDQRNLGLQGWKHLSDAFRQMKGEKVYSKLTWYENALAGIGYLSGIPFKTMMTDGKAVFKMFGLTTPKLLQDQLDRLDSIGSSTKDMNRGKSSDSGVTSEKASKDDKGSSAGSAHLWTYDNAPFHVEDGSLADNFLNHFGINLTSAELAAIERSEEEKEIDAKIQDIKSKTEGLSQEEKNQKIYSMVTRYMKDHQDGKPMADYIAAGDYWSIGDIGNMYIRAGGDGEYFKEKVFRASKSAMKKTISADNNESQKAAQARIKDYLLTNGMTEQELSDIAYKSYTKKDLQVAFRINDEDAIITEMRALMEAGMTREDIYKVYDNRNRVDLVKYKDAGGKYADRLKSTGTYNWPCNGTITSHFGHRHSPGNGVGSTNHQGLDIGASMGAPVTAADGGTVVMAKWYSGYGKTVQIQHDDGTITQYSHLSWWEPKVGDVVAQGQEIGKVGSTGNSTGPHLHFGVMKDGHYVDPEDYLNKKS